MRHPQPLIALALVLGCAADHQVGRDGGSDAGGDAWDPCTVAGIARCDAACGRNMSFCIQNDVRYEECIAGLCLPADTPLGVQHNGCDDFGTCTDTRVCVFDRAFGGGTCMPEAFCDQAAAEGYPVTCIWSGGRSGGTPRVTGSPHDVATCPATAYPGTPFCGEPCQDACTAFTGTFFEAVHRDQDNRGVCIGRSDTRQLGICGPDVLCSRGTLDGDDWCTGLGLVDQVYPELAGTTCVCLVFRDVSTADGLSDHGFISSRDGCAAYRAIYPGEVDCVVDRDWTTLP